MAEITNRAIQELIKAYFSADGDLMKWSDFLAVVIKLRNPDTPIPPGKSIRFSALPTFNNDAQAGAGGLTAGEIYKTNTGGLQVKL